MIVTGLKSGSPAMVDFGAPRPFLFHALLPSVRTNLTYAPVCWIWKVVLCCAIEIVGDSIDLGSIANGYGKRSSGSRAERRRTQVLSIEHDGCKATGEKNEREDDEERKCALV